MRTGLNVCPHWKVRGSIFSIARSTSSLGTAPPFSRFLEMPRKLVKVEVVVRGASRFLVKSFSDGTEERLPIVEEPPKKKRLSAKIAWYWDLKTGRRKLY
jgi:hypothetical protein